jgi:hypothetical protein
MKLITKEIHNRLLANGVAKEKAHDPKPVLKLFTPWAGATWLLTEMDSENEDILFGLCDLGHGFPELDYVSLAEVMALRGPFGLKVERDLYFKATKTLSEYADEAREKGRIVA